jgi:predicted amino acid racemase
MEGGIPEEDALEAIERINSFPNVKVVGVTSFPCLLYDLKTMKPAYMPNIDTIGRVAKAAKEHGFQITQVNAPPMCITQTINWYAQKGATHLEPGLGISGMSPWQLYEPQVHPEIPAGVYVTEVSHFWDNFAYVYGGGFGYIEIFELAYDGKSYVPDASKLKMKAFVGPDAKHIIENPVEAEHYHGILDYHARLYRNASVKIGDTVVYGYRAQMFTTRAHIAVVAGLKENNPELVGLFDSAHNLIDRNGYTLGEKKTAELMKKYC